MTSEELRKVIKCGETSLVQFKQEFTTQKEIATEMIAFANSRGGTILFGVKDKTGEILGLSYDEIQTVSRELGNAANEQVRPQIYIQTEVVEIDGKMILVATIQEGNQFTAIVSRPDLSPHSTSFLAKSGDKSQDTVEGTTLKTTQKSTQKSSQKSSQKIIELVTENHTITTQEMANRLGISRRAIAKAIAILQNNGIIRRIGPDKGGYWEVIEDES